MKAAAKRPAPADQISFVKRYVAIAVNPENIGAVNTHTSCICVVKPENQLRQPIRVLALNNVPNAFRNQ